MPLFSVKTKLIRIDCHHIVILPSKDENLMFSIKRCIACCFPRSKEYAKSSTSFSYFNFMCRFIRSLIHSPTQGVCGRGCQVWMFLVDKRNTLTHPTLTSFFRNIFCIFHMTEVRQLHIK